MESGDILFMNTYHNSCFILTSAGLRVSGVNPPPNTGQAPSSDEKGTCDDATEEHNKTSPVDNK